MVAVCLALALSPFRAIHAQGLSKRLILKDGSYQSVTKYEVKGERVRYLSAERGEWEELPKSMVDWAATDKYEKDRAAGASTPEAIELDKELEADRQAEEASEHQGEPPVAADPALLLVDPLLVARQPDLVADDALLIGPEAALQLRVALAAVRHRGLPSRSSRR